MQCELNRSSARTINIAEDFNISDSDIFNTHMSFYSGKNVEDPFKEYREQKCAILLNQTNAIRRQLTKKKEQLVQQHETALAQGEQSYNELLFYLSLDYNKFVSQMNENKTEILNEFQRNCQRLIELQNEIALYLGSAYLNSVLQHKTEEDLKAKIGELARKVKGSGGAALATELETRFSAQLQGMLAKVGAGLKPKYSFYEPKLKRSKLFHYQSVASICTKPKKASPRAPKALAASSLIKSSPIFEYKKTRYNVPMAFASFCPSDRKNLMPLKNIFPLARQFSSSRKFANAGESDSNSRPNLLMPKKKSRTNL